MPGGYETGCPLGEGMAVMKRNIKILLDIANSFLYDMCRMKKTCTEIKSVTNQECFLFLFFYAFLARENCAGSTGLGGFIF